MQHEVCSVISFAVMFYIYNNRMASIQNNKDTRWSVHFLSCLSYVWYGHEAEETAFWWFTDLLCTIFSTMCCFKNWSWEIIRTLNFHLFSLKPSSSACVQWFQALNMWNELRWSTNSHLYVVRMWDFYSLEVISFLQPPDSWHLVIGWLYKGRPESKSRSVIKNK
jgi:hypothetical protein